MIPFAACESASCETPRAMASRRNTVGRALIVGLAPAEGSQVTRVAKGTQRATRVLGFIAAWSVFRHLYGRDPESMQEIAAELEVDDATVYRWAADLRRVFPQYPTPAEFLEAHEVEAGTVLSARRVREMRLAR